MSIYAFRCKECSKVLNGEDRENPPQCCGVSSRRSYKDESVVANFVGGGWARGR
jgi:hypothetical protein